jgi:hypothetical protein
MFGFWFESKIFSTRKSAHLNCFGVRRRTRRMLIWPKAFWESTAAPPLLISLPQQITWPAPYSISRARSLSLSLTHSRLWNRQRSDDRGTGCRNSSVVVGPRGLIPHRRLQSAATPREQQGTTRLWSLYSLRARRHEIWFATSLLLTNLARWKTSLVLW